MWAYSFRSAFVEIRGALESCVLLCLRVGSRHQVQAVRLTLPSALYPRSRPCSHPEAFVTCTSVTIKLWNRVSNPGYLKVLLTEFHLTLAKISKVCHFRQLVLLLLKISNLFLFLCLCLPERQYVYLNTCLCMPKALRSLKSASILQIKSYRCPWITVWVLGTNLDPLRAANALNL